ncbi:30S ribosomal protein S8 [Candidatus Daviesbacteria bacterium]|nr:30S ribosomal protein S8 [Candidatus Daviesbacteria bacterium]
MVSDPVGDVLIRIKNSYLASKSEVIVPYSKLVFNICQIILQAGYLSDVKNEDKVLKLTLKYQNRAPVLTDVKRISKPGLRVYKGSRVLPYVQNGLGIAIISTPQGLMTDKEARQKGVGGEIMAFVW